MNNNALRAVILDAATLGDEISLAPLAAITHLTVHAITAPEEDRVTRLTARDSITREHAIARIRAQKPESYFREKCDYVLENNDTQANFHKKCLAFFRDLTIIKENP